MPQKTIRTKDGTVLIGTTPDAWTRSFGYKWMHEVVTLDGAEIGRIQTRIVFKRGRFPERVEVQTSVGGSGVIGRDYEWLLLRWREERAHLLRLANTLAAADARRAGLEPIPAPGGVYPDADALADAAEAAYEARLSDAMEGRWDRARFVR